MIEKASESGASAPVPSTPEAPHLSAGELLRQAREVQGIHQDAVAAALKVPVQKIEALENDALDLLPDAVFARALAASMCRALHVDPAPVLARLPGAPRTLLADADKTINANFRGGSERTGRGAWRSSRGLMVVIVLLLVSAVMLYFMPESLLKTLSASLQKPTRHGADTSESVPLSSAESQALSAGDAANTLPGTVTEAVVSGVPAASLPVPVASAGSATVASLPGASAASVAAAGGQPLVFTVRAESWITVTDSQGVVLLKRIVPAGETVGVSGSLPLSVIVGRAQWVDVQVRGQAFDLKPLMGSGGVARFSVKP